MMSEVPNDRRGGDNMVIPVKKAASAPEGDSERLRKPWPARKLAMRIGTNGMSDALKAIIVWDDLPWETVSLSLMCTSAQASSFKA